jgi:hypothetical protein
VLARTIMTATLAVRASTHPTSALLQDMGRFAEAEPLFVAALEILRAKLGPDHPNTKTVEANYAAFRAERDGGASE